MTMFNAMIITLMLGAGFTTVLEISMFTLIFSSFFWEKCLKVTKKLVDVRTSTSKRETVLKYYELIKPKKVMISQL